VPGVDIHPKGVYVLSKMMAKRLALASILLAAACSLPQAGNSGRPDMTAFSVATDRYVIRYTGAPGMTSAAIRRELTLRAAELTLEHGYRYFFLDSRGADYGRGDGSGIPIGPVRRSDLIDPCGPEMETGGGATEFYASTAVVRMFRETSGRAQLLDAQQILAESNARDSAIEMRNR
jgi:hypothetical protein